MGRLPRRSRWFFAAAGALATFSPAWSQVPAPAPASGMVQMGSPAPVASTLALDEEHARLEEIKVELAWLADPGTFPYQMRASASGLSMEVHGYVFNDGVHQQALKVARENTSLTIIDSIKVHPSLAIRSGSASADELRRKAGEMLADTFGEQASHVEIKANAAGRITISGKIPSYEEKLAVSRHMRKLVGCTSVVNQLAVTPVLRKGKAYFLISSDGEHMVPVQPPSAPHPAKDAAKARTPAVAPHPAAYAARLAVPPPALPRGPAVIAQTPNAGLDNSLAAGATTIASTGNAIVQSTPVTVVSVSDHTRTPVTVPIITTSPTPAVKPAVSPVAPIISTAAATPTDPPRIASAPPLPPLSGIVKPPVASAAPPVPVRVVVVKPQPVPPAISTAVATPSTMVEPQWRPSSVPAKKDAPAPAPLSPALASAATPDLNKKPNTSNVPPIMSSVVPPPVPVAVVKVPEAPKPLPQPVSATLVVSSAPVQPTDSERRWSLRNLLARDSAPGRVPSDVATLQPTPMPEPKPTPRPPGQPYEASGVMSFSLVSADAHAVPPTIPPSTGVIQTARATNGSPHVATATLTQVAYREESNASRVAPVPAATQRISTDGLKRKIETVCGLPPKSVELKFESDKCISLTITVPASAHVEGLAQRIFEMPDLAGYDVLPQFTHLP